MYVKKMSEKRKVKYEGLFQACKNIEPGQGAAFVYDTKTEALSAKSALYNYMKISGLIVYRRIQKIGNDSTKFWLENTCKPSEIISTTSDMETLKNTLKSYDSEFRITIIDFLRDSKMLSVDQAVKLNTFHQKMKSGSNANTGQDFEKVQKVKSKQKYVRKSNMSEAIRQAAEKFPTPELPMENPIQNPFKEE
jgi:hypothetical protein